MPEAFFQVELSVATRVGGEAELVVPAVLNDSKYHFVVVNEGAEEGIIKLEASKKTLERVAGEESCTKLTAAQVKRLERRYPPAKIKQRLRKKARDLEEESGALAEHFEVDDQGEAIVDTLQTVRSGFYLIDVLILTRAGTR